MKRTPFSTAQRKPLARVPFVSKPKPMRKKASKPKTRKSATGPMVEPEYADAVRGEDCCACGASGPSDIHHCKDRPPFVELGVYRYFPEYGDTSADADGIPLCRFCHNLYHRKPDVFHAKYGVDYQYIPTTRAALRKVELSF